MTLYIITPVSPSGQLTKSPKKITGTADKLYEYYDLWEVIGLKYAIIGGDRRSSLLAEALAADGYTVHCFALEKAEMSGCINCACLLSCLYGAECVILPIPAEKSGMINTPLSDRTLRTEELTACLNSGQRLVGGSFGKEFVFAAKASGAKITDLLKDEAFAAYNASLTAEAAVGMLICESDTALAGSRILVLGYGRIGRELAKRLALLGAEVTVAARGAEARADAERTGVSAVTIEALDDITERFDFIVNTVPARILSNTALCGAAESAILMELASAPGGFDGELARNIGLKTLFASGLPGKFSPRSSAQYIKRYITSHEL